MTIFAIDLGNKQTNLTDGKVKMVLPSVILSKHDVQSVFSLTKPKGVREYQPSGVANSYYWGKGLLSYSQNKLIDSIGFDGRYNRSVYKLLTEFSLATLAFNYEDAKKGVLTTNVVAGLPTGDYNKENIVTVIKHLNKQHLVSIDGQPVSVKVEHTEILPQPIGTLYSVVLDDKGYVANEDLLDMRIAIVDIGGGTVLLDQITKSQLDAENRMQLETGINTLYIKIRNAINTKFGINADLHTIETLIRTGLPKKQFSYKRSANNILDVTDIVLSEIDFYTQQISDQIYSTFKNISEIDRVIFTGGGTSIINHRIIKDAFPQTQAIFTEDPENANVTGFYKYGLSRKLEEETEK